MTINTFEKFTYILFIIVIYSVKSLQVNKVISGQKAGENQFPYAVSIQSYTRQRCGGSILSKWYVLTACHCIVHYNMSHGRLGTYDIRKLRLVAGSSFRFPSKRSQVRNVDYAFVHPKCRATRNRFLVFDVALLKTVTPFRMHKFVQPLPILSFEKSAYLEHREYLTEYEVLCQTIGWGNTAVVEPLKKYSLPSDDLLILDVKLIGNSACFRILCEFHTGFCSMNENSFEMLCAVGPDGKDVCTGDSGGSLVCNGYGFGIVSWGPACGEVLAPTIYQPIYEVLDFFKEVMTKPATSTKRFNLDIKTE
ncbi:kallikrein-12-like [Cimex lectularius]|uniref:Peptidase S1 domain-containing protein n=1 Tax=Cimex lectularius TaxID=79782 RepID=A0A8I6S7V5_CIMLE|nr:kallikrein-12-like [Cimex lectularius]